MMMRLILLTSLSLLAACATPRQSCVQSATRDLQTVDRLIAQTQGNLSRGYGIEREAYVSSTVDLCVGNGYRGLYRGAGVGWSYCSRPTTRYRDTPVTIDLATEQRKLAELKQTRARLLKEAEPKLEFCNLKYPAN